MMDAKILQQEGARILFVADIRGQLSLFNQLADKHNADVIIHTGNFGFLESSSIDRIHESYLRHIVEFSPLLPEHLIFHISKLSKVHGDSVEHLSNENENLKKLLQKQELSELTKFINGELKLNVPVYTIYGMCEDSLVINKFRYGVYAIPNLHIIDDASVHTITLEKSSQVILLAGIGGSLSYHKLFHQGSPQDIKDIISNDELCNLPQDIIPISGDPGNIWITMLQIGRLIHTLTKFSEQQPDLYNKAIKFFITHQSPTREPLIEHLSIFFKMDYTISNSLHFKYISSYNELTINPSFENFKIKFNDSRTKLSKIWSKLQKKYEKLLQQLPNSILSTYVELALSVYDKIPISSKTVDEILPLSLSPGIAFDEDLQTKHEVNAIIRQLNDLYYIAFQNAWHYNLCDFTYGHLMLNLENGKVGMECVSNGFDFSYRLLDPSGMETTQNKQSQKANTTTFSGSPRSTRALGADNVHTPSTGSNRGKARGRGGRGGYHRDS